MRSLFETINAIGSLSSVVAGAGLFMIFGFAFGTKGAAAALNTGASTPGGKGITASGFETAVKSGKLSKVISSSLPRFIVKENENNFI